MTYHDRILTVALAAALVGAVGLGSGAVPLTPAHRPKPTAEARAAAIERR